MITKQGRFTKMDKKEACVVPYRVAVNFRGKVSETKEGHNAWISTLFMR